MNKKEEEFLKRLQVTFRIEAEEHIQVLSSGLITLEKDQNANTSRDLVETIFREAHSLKGAARSVNRMDIEAVCQVLESVFAILKSSAAFVTAAHFDVAHKAVDSISRMVSDPEKVSAGESKELIKLLQGIIPVEKMGQSTEEQMSAAEKPVEKDSELPAPATEAPPGMDEAKQKEPFHEKAGVPAEGAQAKADDRSSVVEEPDKKQLQLETVRIPIGKLDPLFLEAEQMIQLKIAAAQRLAELKSISSFVESWKTEARERDTRRSAERDASMNGMLDWNKTRLKELEEHLAAVSHDFDSDRKALERMIDDHLESMKKILMLHVSSITENFPKFVRDMARSQGKEVELLLHGTEVEVDKRILEDLKDPLIHLIRNCINHGIKTPDVRLKDNKNSRGAITLNFSTVDGRNLEIEISDDGDGINTDKVIAAAIKKGVVSRENVDKLDTQEALALLFKSGITTSPMITDISGRGLGLAIVLEKVEKLGGTVSVENRPKAGATFRLIVPLTFSTFRGVLVRAGEHLFFLPTANVQRVVRVAREEIRTVENRPTILYEQEIVAVVPLGDALGLRNGANRSSGKNNSSMASQFFQFVVLAEGGAQIAFMVDEIFSEHQILIKKLGKQLVQVRNISGATVLGSGKVVPVINVADLMKSAMNARSETGSAATEKQTEQRTTRILAVDDSITSRTLIKNILDMAGYDVVTAVDGVDAFSKLLTGAFDLIVSDVDMPRMNGFELTTKIRQDKKLSDLPIVLVTALESREDREHGIDVGANAYIIKSGFDQSNLLEVIKKLI